MNGLKARRNTAPDMDGVTYNWEYLIELSWIVRPGK